MPKLPTFLISSLKAINCEFEAERDKMAETFKTVKTVSFRNCLNVSVYLVLSKRNEVDTNK